MHRFAVLCVLAACGDDGGSSDAAPTTCELTAATDPTTVTSPSGCAVLDREAAQCQVARMTAGLSGVWLQFSCRVELSAASSGIQARSDGRPDHASNYFAATDPCHEDYTGAMQNPNRIGTQDYTFVFPTAPNVSPSAMLGGVVGLALDGVAIFGAFAAPGMDIYTEVLTFDRCGAHPDMNGRYHYHGEPYAISYDDRRLIGVMRDGYAIYGRYDSDGSTPTLDLQGGHTSTTIDSPTPVYHYHLNLQTSTEPGTAGQMQWFLTKGMYYGTPGTCTGC